jgi:hypothetical protein
MMTVTPIEINVMISLGYGFINHLTFHNSMIFKFFDHTGIKKN